MPLPALSLPRRRPPARARRAPARASWRCWAAAGCGCATRAWWRSTDVSVTGLSGTEAPRVRAALEGAARDMTTLHVRPDQLRTAVEPFPVDHGGRRPRRLPARAAHRRPRARRRRGAGRRAPIACPSPPTAPCCAAARPAACRSSPWPPRRPATRSRDKRALRAVTLLAAAPPELRAKVSRVYAGPARPHGAAGRRPGPLLRRRRPPAGEVDRGRPRARRPQLGGRDLHRSAPARAPGRRRPRGPDARRSPSSRRRAVRRSARSPRSPRPAPAARRNRWDHDLTLDLGRGLSRPRISCTT